MREIRTSGLMSGDGKRSVATQGPSYRARPRLYDGSAFCRLPAPKRTAETASYGETGVRIIPDGTGGRVKEAIGVSVRIPAAFGRADGSYLGNPSLTRTDGWSRAWAGKFIAVLHEWQTFLHFTIAEQ